MTYQLAIFDFDGTLADSAPWFRTQLNALALRHGFRQTTDAEIETLRGRSNQEIMADLGVARWRLPLIATDLRRRMAKDAEAIPLFHGVPELLKRLEAARVRTAVVSSNSEANVRKILGPYLTGTVEVYDCGAGLFGKAKRFARVIRRSGVPAGEVICIGDELRDMEAAHAVGAVSGTVTWGYATPESLVRGGPTLTFSSVMEIAERLARA